MESSERSVALLVRECGAPWPKWASEIRARADNAVVESQLEHESDSAFEARVLRRLEQCGKEGTSLVTVGYICALHQRDYMVRTRLTQALVHALAASPDTELVLGGGAWAGSGSEGEERSRMMALWGRLSIEVPGRLVSVRFDLPADPPSSGVFVASAPTIDLEADERPSVAS